MLTSRAHFILRIYPLFSQNKYLILIVDGVGEEWDELWSGALHAQGQRDRRQLLDRVQPQLHKIMVAYHTHSAKNALNIECKREI